MFPHQHRQLPPQPHFLLYHPQNAASWRRFRGPDLRFQFQLRFVPLLSHPLRLEKMYIVLHKIKTLIEDCSNGRNKFNLVVQIETVVDTFHRLTGELSTLLDVFPLQELHLNGNVQELVILLRKQCSESIPFVGAEQISCQMEMVGRIRHDNVTALRAYYYSKEEKLMVYDYYEQDSVSLMLHTLAVLLDFLLQITAFVALVTLDFNAST
ncbi:uncharacterized protein LOC109792769 isoform X1 [Cajanus cajan]|uniref:uncharacterized protein LOC109792769 isoform X1 n=1 Tax=Cajanus cajan TaxID=3821 RepID=UPI00098DCAE5|nr:uncharacterized protein LOC109792769 isoform X1 [Cajanus cajan]